MRAIVNCKMRELAIALQLFVIIGYNFSINTITNPSLVSSH
jgi:hypothetical protein